MDRDIRYRVRGLDDTGKAQRAETVLYGRTGIHEVAADPMSGQVWLRFDEDEVPPPRLKDYLRDAGLEPVGEPEEA